MGPVEKVLDFNLTSWHQIEKYPYHELRKAITGGDLSKNSEVV